MTFNDMDQADMSGEVQISSRRLSNSLQCCRHKSRKSMAQIVSLTFVICVCNKELCRGLSC